MAADDQSSILLNLTTEIVASYAENNRLAAADLPRLIAEVHQSLSAADQPIAESAPAGPKGMTTARKSLSDPARIISMIDGKPYATLSRHIKGHGYTAQSYREAFGLAADYPMTAPAYSDKRRALAMAIGLGRKQTSTAQPAPAPKKLAAKPRTTKAVLAKSKKQLSGS